MVDLESVLAGHRAVICVGPGGVGKTSVSAALGIQGAQSGKRTVVLTIDPARRLANALGLPEIGSVERDIPESAFTDHQLHAPRARLSAMMLDVKEAWDDVVRRYHPDPKAREQLLSNRLYRAMSSALAGSQEYMAMEKLYQLSQRTADPPELIVLDTPPAAHAMDFLEAPNRMLNALDNDATRWLLEPFETRQRMRLGRRLFDAGSALFVKTIAKLTGRELLDDLAELLSGFQGMFEGFRARAKAVEALLSSPETAFVVVGRPTPQGGEEAAAFVRRLQEVGIRPKAVVMNRAIYNPFEGAPDPDPIERFCAARGQEALAVRLLEEARVVSETDARERQLCQRLSETVEVVLRVPELSGDVHDLLGLETLRMSLFKDKQSEGRLAWLRTDSRV